MGRDIFKTGVLGLGNIYEQLTPILNPTLLDKKYTKWMLMI